MVKKKEAKKNTHLFNILFITLSHTPQHRNNPVNKYLRINLRKKSNFRWKNIQRRTSNERSMWVILLYTFSIERFKHLFFLLIMVHILYWLIFESNTSTIYLFKCNFPKGSFLAWFVETEKKYQVGIISLCLKYKLQV